MPQFATLKFEVNNRNTDRFSKTKQRCLLMDMQYDMPCFYHGELTVTQELHTESHQYTVADRLLASSQLKPGLAAFITRP